MIINFSLSSKFFERLNKLFDWLVSTKGILIISIIAAISASLYFYIHGYTVAYGDAESHLNIAKRVVQSLTPGLAQLGGIWLPLPHILMLPFVTSNFLWRSGLAGSIVSGAAFIISSVYLYKLVYLLTQNKIAAFIGAIVFISNPNVLYLQSTPMTELSLIVFFILSSYYFVKYIQDDSKLISLLLSAFFGFCAALSRYDGWGLVVAEAGILTLYYFPYRKVPLRLSQIKEYWDKKTYNKLEGVLIMFCTLAFFAIIACLMWGYLILCDPLYFTHSQFSSKSQQQLWLARGELPAYHHIFQSLLYYIVTAMSNAEIVIFGIALVAFVIYLFDRNQKHRFLIAMLLLVPFVFNVATLYMGQSVIFIPHVTPVGFDWRLFNVRYGVMMIPMVAFLVGFIFSKIKLTTRWLIVGLMIVQIGLFGVGYSKIIKPTINQRVVSFILENIKPTKNATIGIIITP